LTTCSSYNGHNGVLQGSNAIMIGHCLRELLGPKDIVRSKRLRYAYHIQNEQGCPGSLVVVSGYLFFPFPPFDPLISVFKAAWFLSLIWANSFVLDGKSALQTAH